MKNSRWTLKMLLIAFKSWLKVSTQYGVWSALKSLKIHHKRTANHVHSPDAAYDAKLAHIIEQIGKYSPYSLDGKRPCIVLFGDECTVYSKATQSYDWELSTQEPKAELGLNYSQSFRIAATLDIWTGKVVSMIRQKLTIASMIAFYKSICEAYPGCDILLIQDNWPVHYHPDIRAALLPQKMPFEVKLPKSWEFVQASNKYKQLNLPIYTISLPTYASWLNPIEKLWRILKQDLLHKHPFTDNFNELKIKTQEYLNTFKEHSLYLLNYVGLFNADSILGKPTLNIFKNWGLPKVWTDEYF
jgi:DDE superfamily endonuclease